MSSVAKETVPRFRRGGWMFLVPAGIPFVAFVLWPLIHGVALGFFDDRWMVVVVRRVAATPGSCGGNRHIELESRSKRSLRNCAQRVNRCW